MLAAKTDKKKNSIQIIILFIILIIIGVLVYKNFFSSPNIDTPAINQAANSGTSGEALSGISKTTLPKFSAEELDFTQKASFRNLRNFSQPITAGEDRSPNPFFNSEE